MNKVILKTALGTLAALALAALLTFSLWILISPQSMATLSEKTGNYSFAVTCADLRYKYSGSVDDLARCTQNSILAKKDKLIVKYGEKLIADEGFEGFCEKMDGNPPQIEGVHLSFNYKSYVCGNLSAAQYRTGDLQKAVKTAQAGGSFSQLVIEIIEHGTAEQAQEVLEALSGYDENLTKLLEEFITKGV